MELIKVINAVLLGISLTLNLWALLDLVETIKSTDDKLKRNTGLVMAFGFIAMSVVGALSLIIYSTNGDHSLTFLRTTTAAIANICFGVSYGMLRSGII